MVRKAKVYGKQKTNELVSAIQNLNLNTSPKGIDFSSQSNSILPATHILLGPYIDIPKFPALAPVTGNKSRAVRTQKNELKDDLANVENVLKRKILQPIHGSSGKGLTYYQPMRPRVPMDSKRQLGQLEGLRSPIQNRSSPINPKYPALSSPLRRVSNCFREER